MRLQRYAVFLAGLNYDILHRTAAKNANADSLSRLPLPSQRTAVDTPDKLHINMLQELPIHHKEVRCRTQQNAVLSRVYTSVQTGKWAETDHEFVLYYRRRTDLSTQLGCLLWRARVAIPPSQCAAVLEEIHKTHAGIVRSKALARSYFWWPNLDNDIEQIIKSCLKCVTYIKNPPEVQLQSWNVTESPWERVHIDYAGPLQGHLFLIIVDSKSKWLEAEIVESTDNKTTIAKLQSCFARHGIPKYLVSDNAAGFTSQPFATFLSRIGTKHIKSTPHHPKTNGLAEKMVHFVKTSMKAL